MVVFFVTQEASAVQRAKRALKEQLNLRGEAARKAQKLRDEQALALAEAADSGVGDDGGGEGRGDGRRREFATRELAELEERIGTGSMVCARDGLIL